MTTTKRPSWAHLTYLARTGKDAWISHQVVGIQAHPSVELVRLSALVDTVAVAVVTRYPEAQQCAVDSLTLSKVRRYLDIMLTMPLCALEVQWARILKE